MTARTAFGSGIAALTAIVLVSASLVACGTESTTQIAVETAAPEPQTTLASPPASTATDSPTEIPAATLPQEPVLGPEQPAVSVDQVAGIWDVSHSSEGLSREASLAFGQDGSYRTEYSGQNPDAGLAIDIGTYHFDQDLLVLESDYCWLPLGDVYTCTATYHVFVAMADGAPGRLRFQLVEDPDADRAKYLTGKTHPVYGQG